MRNRAGTIPIGSNAGGQAAMIELPRPSPRSRGAPAELGPEVLRKRFPADSLRFETTAELEPFEDVVAQPRAAAALEFGTAMREAGYHLFVLGEEGTGRHSIALRMLLQSIRAAPRYNDSIGERTTRTVDAIL